MNEHVEGIEWVHPLACFFFFFSTYGLFSSGIYRFL